MHTMNISLPKAMKAFVEAQVNEGGYRTPSEFIRDLIREAQQRKLREKVDALLLDGLNSGDAIEVTPEFWEERRRRAVERTGNKPKKR